MSRAAAAALLLLSGAQLASAWVGGGLVSTPALLLGTALAGYLVGAVVPRWAAAGLVVVSAGALASAHQLDSPGAYPVLDDFVFSLLTVGAPALAGAVVRVRASQVRELQRVADLLSAQRAAEVRAAQLEERNRVQLRLHRGFTEQVAAIAMRAESAVGVDGGDGGAARQALADVETAARQGLDELRAALGALRVEATLSPTSGGTGSARAEPLGPVDVGLAATVAVAVAVESVVSPQAEGPVVLNVLMGLSAGAPLAVRRHRPLAACALSLTALAAMSAWLTPATAMVTSISVLLVCSYVVGAHVAGRGRVVGVALVLGGLGLLAVLGTGGPPEAADVVPMVVFIGLAVGVGVVSAGWSVRAAELSAAVAELERGRDVEVGLAVAEQRNRLASELHDTVAHAMTVICLQASAGQVGAASASQEEPLDAILTTARTALGELRNGLENATERRDLGVEDLAAQAGRAGLRPEVRVTGRLEDLPSESRRVAVRIMREAITNAGRYAPGSVVVIEVDAGPQLQLRVTDAGAGPLGGGAGDVGAGTGLQGLAEEVARVGGTLSWGPTEAGFSVEAALPGVEVLV